MSIALTINVGIIYVWMPLLLVYQFKMVDISHVAEMGTQEYWSTEIFSNLSKKQKKESKEIEYSIYYK